MQMSNAEADQDEEDDHFRAGRFLSNFQSKLEPTLKAECYVCIIWPFVRMLHESI